MVVPLCPFCDDGTGCLVDFTDLPKKLTSDYDDGGVLSNFMGSWHGLSIHSFYGVWAGTTAVASIPDAARYATTAPSGGVIYTTDNYVPPSYFEKVAGTMQVRYFYAMAAWYNSLQLTATGYLAGVPVAQINITLPSAHQVKVIVPPEWPPIQTLYITAAGGTPGPFTAIPSGQENSVVLDNICYDAAPQLIPVVDNAPASQAACPYTLSTFDEITQLGDLYGYKGLGWIGWQSTQPAATSKGVVSKPTVAMTVVTYPRIGFNAGPLFYLRSFYVTGFCRNYLQLNVTGYVRGTQTAFQSVQLGTTIATSLIVLPTSFNFTDQVNFVLYGGQPMFMMVGAPALPNSCSLKESQLFVDNVCIDMATF